ncbi:hypothetical protein A1O7_06780 [Cladophialophora yegresii CBS 114405]|uniref:Major facilitator superfamily (MFS) profile domain-containing protein n=1 Tax=Cladophialophora yegresii CBS 114405 TaxID=1182544 RepID=W9VW34_9EURO|nr:uncharacterized protein A1O7_06780 [Cladophialophora yegresii CBS 114405]EXJ56436.1 hypothetical protein A1O7_06780 [Cladophialophora yegresii CBS 114405]
MSLPTGSPTPAFQSTWGKAYKYFPIKRVFLLTVVIFKLGNTICAVAPSSSFLVLGRMVAGMGGGGAGSVTGAFITIAISVRPQYRAAYMGVLGVTSGTASVVGPLLGGVLNDGPGWQWCFCKISLPLGALAASIMVMTVRQLPSPESDQVPLKEKVVSLDLAGSLRVLGAEDMVAATALTLFSENLGTSIFIAATEAAFTNSLISGLGHNVPKLKPELVVNAGATEIRKLFAKDQIPGILESYLQGCKDSQLVPVACGGAATAVSMLLAVPAIVRSWDDWKHKPHAR